MGCSEELDLYAPAEEIYAVYGLLDAAADTQYVRVSEVFQAESDAFEFAQDYDASVPGLEVVVAGGGNHYVAQWRDSLLKDTLRGDFGAYTGAYFFVTTDSVRLVPGERYTLSIRSPLDSSFHLSASTRIPPDPRLISPRVSVNSSNEECLPLLAIEDSLYVIFQRNPNQQRGEAWGYQLRINFRYRVDGISQNHAYGPTRLFNRSTGCEGPSGQTLCYRLGGGAVFNSLRHHLGQATGLTTYDAEPRCTRRFTGYLSDAIEVEVAAVDSALGRYIEVNSPFFRSINPVKPEFTNLTGTPRAVGVFGSVSRSQSPVTLSPCVEYRLGLWAGEEDPCE